MFIISSRIAFNYLRKLLTSDAEELWVVALTSDKHVIKSTCIFKGTVDSCPIHPREIFRFAYMQNSSAILIAHNHPSADARPSKEDIRVTHNLWRASEILQLPIVDHIILGGDSYWSFADHDLLMPRRRSRLNN